MSDMDEQLARVCAWNRELADENRRLREQACRQGREICRLQGDLAAVRSECQALDIALGAAMDEALAARRP